MEIKISTEQILQFLHLLSWVIFIGLCIEAGSFIFNAIYALYYNPNAADYFGMRALLNNNPESFATQMALMTIVGILKALMFYLIVKILYEKKVSLSSPFNKHMGEFLSRICYLTLGISTFSYWGSKNIAWLANQGIKTNSIQKLGFGGADVWLFMSIVLFVISQLFKKGIEIQSENELTI